MSHVDLVPSIGRRYSDGRKKNGLSKNSKIKTISSLRDLVLGLEMGSTDISSLRDLVVSRFITER
jgi:hypothetical protein